jgi:hypothetical protein
MWVRVNLQPQEAGMQQSGPITIRVDQSLSDDARESLLRTLREYATVDDTTDRTSPEAVQGLLTFIAVMKDVAPVVGSISGALTIGQKIADWRKGLRGQDATAPRQLERPGKQPLDLATATDAEVLAWFHETRTKA